jgi:hypothetical protein
VIGYDHLRLVAAGEKLKSFISGTGFLHLIT